MFIDYYKGISESRINRAIEFRTHISVEKIMKYRDSYSHFLKKNNKFKYKDTNEDYINRMNYYDNFVSHILNADHTFEACKYFKYHEY